MMCALACKSFVSSSYELKLISKCAKINLIAKRLLKNILTLGLFLPFFFSFRPCTHGQINPPLFAQIFAELLHTDGKFEQIKSIYLLHAFKLVFHTTIPAGLFYLFLPFRKFSTMSWLTSEIHCSS